jgi:N-acetylglucosaminyldiphosphoundecaprenol N-acetyl-beta-D-mannosaminyltransferase
VDSVDAAEERLANGDEPGPPLELHSVNAEISVQVRDDPRYRALLAENPLNLPDGEWIRRLAGTKYRRSFERISGSDMVGELCELAAREAWGVFLLGAAEDVSALAAERLRARYPDLALDRFSPPYEPGPEVSDATTAEVLARIEAARPTVLLAFLGSPKQELWCRAHAARLSAAGVRVALGAGAGLDFLAGRVRRAPAVVSRSGLEWLWRLAHQPRARFGRAVRRLPRFLVLALREALVGRLREAHFPQPPVHDERALGPAHGPRTKPPRTGAEAP